MRKSSNKSEGVPRPPSAASRRPPSSAATSRPPSSASLFRPASSASVRSTISRLSNRPTSRLSTRPGTRLSARVAPHTEALVRGVTGLDPDDAFEEYEAARTYATQTLESEVGLGSSLAMSDVDRHIRGRAQRARIMVQEQFATALNTAYARLKSHLDDEVQDLDQSIQQSKIPDHLQFILALASPPSSHTLGYATQYLEDINNPQRVRGLTWAQIFAEDPLEGQHWEGAYGLPAGSMAGGHDAATNQEESDSDGTDLSQEPFELDKTFDNDLALSEMDATSVSSSSGHMNEYGDLYGNTDVTMRMKEAYAQRKVVEELQSRQYWSEHYKPDFEVSVRFSLSDASSLEPSVDRTLRRNNPEKEVRRYIQEHDAYREVLMALQGRPNLLIIPGSEATSHDPYLVSPAPPRLLHLTGSAYASVLASFANMCNSTARLRSFVSRVYDLAFQTLTPGNRKDGGISRPSWSSSVFRKCRTLEALAEAIDAQLQGLLNWCASAEETLILAQAGHSPDSVVASLLSLENIVMKEWGAPMGAFVSLLANVGFEGQDYAAVMHRASATLAKRILDDLLAAAHRAWIQGESAIAKMLMSAFIVAAEPIWRLSLGWMRDGPRLLASFAGPVIGQQDHGSVDAEFFVEDNELPFLDPDFWKDGFVLRTEETGQGEQVLVPDFLLTSAQQILGAGKAVALLRVLGVGKDHASPALLAAQAKLAELGSLEELVAQRSPHGLLAHQRVVAENVEETLKPYCFAVQGELARQVIQGCDVWTHLQALENLFFMRRGDVAGRFADALFSRMDARQMWADFHFLNVTIQDVLSDPVQSWITRALVRVTYSRSAAPSAHGVEQLCGIKLGYDVPFPLTYVLHAGTMQAYAEVWTFLLQLRRGKAALDKILVRGVEDGLKGLWALRSRLAWFISTIMSFIANDVITTQVVEFHDKFQKAHSLDDMIALHETHLGRVRSQCLLSSKTQSIYSSTIAVLNHAVAFGVLFVSLTSDATLDLSRASLGAAARHRSRRARRERRNIVSFSQEAEEWSNSSEEEDEDEMAQSLASLRTRDVDEDEGDGGITERMDKIAVELDAHVRLVRRGVETLSMGSDDDAGVFGVLSFLLQDWDQ